MPLTSGTVWHHICFSRWAVADLGCMENLEIPAVSSPPMPAKWLLAPFHQWCQSKFIFVRERYKGWSPGWWAKHREVLEGCVLPNVSPGAMPHNFLNFMCISVRCSAFWYLLGKKIVSTQYFLLVESDIFWGWMMVGHGKGVSSSVWECRSYPQKISEIFFMQICTYFVFFWHEDSLAAVFFIWADHRIPQDRHFCIS